MRYFDDDTRAIDFGRADYRDDGCEYWQACLTCPFEQCRFDAPRGEFRRRYVRWRIATEGLEVQGTAAVAAALGVSRDTAVQYLREVSYGTADGA